MIAVRKAPQAIFSFEYELLGGHIERKLPCRDRIQVKLVVDQLSSEALPWFVSEFARVANKA